MLNVKIDLIKYTYYINNTMSAFLKLLVKKRRIILVTVATTLTSDIGYKYYMKPDGSDIINRLINIKELSDSNVSTYYRSTNNNVNSGSVTYSCKNTPSIVPCSITVTNNIAQVDNTFGDATYSIDTATNLDTLIGRVIIFVKAGCDNKSKSK